jgi:hypothetical protein
MLTQLTWSLIQYVLIQLTESHSASTNVLKMN